MDWRERALAAISEGACPRHASQLADDGWCGTWWSADAAAQTVTSRYPVRD